MKEMRSMFLCGDLGNSAIIRVATFRNENEDFDLQLVLCTPGGEFSSWCGIIDLLSGHRAKGDLSTVAVGEVCSGGVPILASGCRGRRGIFRHAMIGLHEPFLEHITADPAVQASEMRLLESMRARYYNMFAEFTPHTVKWWRARLANQSMLWIDAKEAIKWGLADVILG